MPQSREKIAEAICGNLNPLRRPMDVDALRPEVENCLELYRELASFVLSLPRGKQCKQLARKAARARATLAPYCADPDLTKLAPALAALDPQLREVQRLERSSGPAPQFDILKWHCADCARALIVEFSSKLPAG